MTIIQTITKSEFTSTFHKMGRGNQFSYQGLSTLYDFLDDLGDDMEEPIELDVIALCCEFAEYDSLREFQEDYGNDYKSLEDIEDRTILIPLDDKKDGLTSFIIKQF